MSGIRTRGVTTAVTTMTGGAPKEAAAAGWGEVVEGVEPEACRLEPVQVGGEGSRIAKTSRRGSR
jgi:hypothetical protein